MAKSSYYSTRTYTPASLAVFAEALGLELIPRGDKPSAPLYCQPSPTDIMNYCREQNDFEAFAALEANLVRIAPVQTGRVASTGKILAALPAVDMISVNEARRSLSEILPEGRVLTKVRKDGDRAVWLQLAARWAALSENGKAAARANLAASLAPETDPSVTDDDETDE